MLLTVLVANPKGGCGKSTLSTHLAGYYAQAGYRTLLGDMDRQQSSARWLTRRPAGVAAIAGWAIDPEDPAPPPKGTQVAILDSAANLHGKKLASLLRKVDRIVVPVMPSPFDTWASEDFFAALAEEKAIRKEKVTIGVVGMRVNTRTRAAGELRDFFTRFELPVITCLRDTQLYVHAASHGLTLFDLPASKVERDRQEWQPLLDWLGLPANARELDV